MRKINLSLLALALGLTSSSIAFANPVDFKDAPKKPLPPAVADPVGNNVEGEDAMEVNCPPGKWGDDAVGGIVFTQTGYEVFRCHPQSKSKSDARVDFDNLKVTIPWYELPEIRVEKLETIETEVAGDTKEADPCYRWRVGGSWYYTCY